MNTNELKNMINDIGLKVEEDKPNVFKGHSCNVRSWAIFRVWLNQSNKVTIKSHGVQKSFSITNKDELKKELKGFEII
ncbi:hypothetical protein [Mammaliicoccus lentus]|uniref:hypothetical protein n=1 Tax=Mammaliicoccus lentus TaxID=42858 RepID=UPI001071F866|nr:hypothetical protein [Mammaliicoccus lentus]MBF0795193.1 hypothetical protein [Mammaliicoccus lentus]TFV14594.1 hypothetical protein E4T78_11050 [Mammaliicoccus lentus]